MVMIGEVNVLPGVSMSKGWMDDTTYLPTGGLACDFVEGDLTDSALCKPVVIDVSLNDLLVFVDLPAPYREEKLSDWRGFRANILLLMLCSLSKWLCKFAEAYDVGCKG